MRRLFIALTVLAGGCVLPQPPPPMSMAKFVRPPIDRNRLGFSTGLAMHIDAEQDAAVYAFPVEAGLGVSLGDRYDLGFSVGQLLGTAEGNFAVIDSDVRLGIIHGLGAGLIATQDDQALVTQFTGGTFLQAGRQTPFFMGFKGTYGTTIGTETVRPTTFYTGTLGFLPSGRVKVVPEIAIQRAAWRLPDGSEPLVSWTSVIGVTVLLHYHAPGL